MTSIFLWYVRNRFGTEQGSLFSVFWLSDWKLTSLSKASEYCAGRVAEFPIFSVESLEMGTVKNCCQDLVITMKRKKEISFCSGELFSFHYSQMWQFQLHTWLEVKITLSSVIFSHLLKGTWHPKHFADVVGKRNESWEKGNSFTQVYGKGRDRQSNWMINSNIGLAT